MLHQAPNPSAHPASVGIAWRD